MSEVYYKCKGSLTVERGSDGNITYEFTGSKVPQKLSDVPAYVAQCIKSAMLGANDSAVDEIKRQLEKANRKIDELIKEKNQKPQQAKQRR